MTGRLLFERTARKERKTMPGDQTHIDPAKLLEHLNREVYGQKWAKEKLAHALAWNQERLRQIPDADAH